MPLPEDESEWKNLMVVFATAKGNIRKNTLEDFVNINNSGKIAMKLDQDDRIIGVKICRDDQDILLSTQFGKCIRFKSKKLRLFKGRSSKGIKGMKLNDKDKIISLSILNCASDNSILSRHCNTSYQHIIYSNIILLSIIMKLSYSFAAIAVSLLSTTEGLQDKNLRSAVSSISTAASSSSTTNADVQKHAGIRHTIRSAAAAYAATPSNNIQRHAAANDGY